MNALFHWLEHSSVSAAIASSTTLTGSLSAVHVIGFVLVTSGALVANARALGLLLSEHNLATVGSQANRVVVVGLTVSLVTGALLFSARATDASANPVFQLKMGLVLAAVLVHFGVARGLRDAGVVLAAVGHAVALFVWLALAVIACAFILLE